MQTASYISVLFDKTTPEEAPHPELFGLFEDLLDLAEAYGRHPQFLVWAELRFCLQHGHAPHLDDCVLCAAKTDLHFCASQGGVVCDSCRKTRKLPALECPPDVLAILRAWKTAEHPSTVIKTTLSEKQHTILNAIMCTFMMYQFNLSQEHRLATQSPCHSTESGNSLKSH